MSDTRSALPLNAGSLPRFAPTVSVPTYDRNQLRRSIVHIGVGGFHRAHFATYVDDLCRAGNIEWSITGAGVLPGDRAMADALGTQDGLYSLITRSPADNRVEIIGSIVEYIHAPTTKNRLVDAIADPDTQIVSLTVTEGGYPIDDLTGDYRPDSSNAGPSGAFGVIAAALDQRRRERGSGLTILSCDNILSNGHAVRTATLGEAERHGSELAAWIDSSVTFPNSMVDRITPATTDADRTWLAETIGIDDRWPVVTEPFRQWVIEDSFAADRLPLEGLDVLATGDVEPYELMKLRLLNAGHSCLAYLSSLAGFSTVDAAMADQGIRSFTEEFLAHEALPVLPPVAGVDLDAYSATLIERFSNPAIGDQISRLCLDGSAKFPKFLLPTIRAQLAVGGPLGLSALALAAWCEYLTQDRSKLAPDPNLDSAIEHANRSKVDPATFLGFAEVFGADLPAANRFTEQFVHALERLRSDGVGATIAATLQDAS